MDVYGFINQFKINNKYIEVFFLNFYLKLFPALRTRYFLCFGAAALPPRRNTKNELKQMLRSGLRAKTLI
jgi:hypothetical protein